MKTIWKFELDMEEINDASETFEVLMPKKAEVIYVDTQYGKPCLWAVVDSDADKELRYFRIAGTGHPLDKKAFAGKHLGSFQLLGGGLVFHLFDAVS